MQIMPAARPMRRTTAGALALMLMTGALIGWAQQKPASDAPMPAVPEPNLSAKGGNTMGFDMAPETTLIIVEGAVKMIPRGGIAPGPYQPTWDSLQSQYRVPQWFMGAKFGLFLHWGIYSVPAHGSEWYEKYMYGSKSVVQWHLENFGPIDKFGYKDFIPLFTQEKFNADDWALLFKQSGARFVVPTAEHHDNFALWDSHVTPFNAMQMGPKRDLIGELSKAVRKQGLKFGVSNHGIENFQFINPLPEVEADLKAKRADLFDPKWADFYNVADRSDAAVQKFLVNWYERNMELIDKYQPDMLWFDNGVDQRYLDPLKVRIAAYYYNRAKGWGKEVTISTKKAAYAPSGWNTETIGSVLDFEGRLPPGIRSGEWQIDRSLGSTWGYTKEMKFKTAGETIAYLAETASKNGTLLLNLSPMADGTIPAPERECLLGIGRWLAVNGEAIYDTHSWVKFNEGSKQKIFFTVKADVLYAILVGPWPGGEVIVTSLAKGMAPEGKIASVTMLGSPDPLKFSQDSSGLSVALPPTPPGSDAYVLKITGLKMNPSTNTASGNPIPGTY
jgi:alpha-L-fucosidase